jgi:hypothetical protein
LSELILLRFVENNRANALKSPLGFADTGSTGVSPVNGARPFRAEVSLQTGGTPVLLEKNLKTGGIFHAFAVFKTMRGIGKMPREVADAKFPETPLSSQKLGADPGGIKMFFRIRPRLEAVVFVV